MNGVPFPSGNAPLSDAVFWKIVPPPDWLAPSRVGAVAKTRSKENVSSTTRIGSKRPVLGFATSRTDQLPPV